MTLKKILAVAAVVGVASMTAPVAVAHDTGAPHGGAAPAAPAYPGYGYGYPPYPYWGDSGSDFMDDGSFFGDTRGRGRGRGSGEGEFNMNFSGKGRGDMDADTDWDGSGYGGSNTYGGPYGYGAPYYGGYGRGPAPQAPARAPAK